MYIEIEYWPEIPDKNIFNFCKKYQLFKHQPHRMDKHSKSFSATAHKLFEYVWPFCRVGA